MEKFIMDVDLYQPDQWSCVPTTSGGSTSLPKIDETEASGPALPKDRLVRILDYVESHIERLRKETVRMEEEKDSLMSTLDSVKQSELLQDISESDRDDVFRYAERIAARAMTVEVSVRTDRDTQQEEALFQVNMFIDHLVMSLQEDAVVAHSRCQTFMNACLSLPNGPTDKNFESAILGCTLDDQKRVKKRLQGLLDYFAKLNIKSF